MANSDPPVQRNQRRIAVVQLDDKYRLSDVLSTIDNLAFWPYADDVQPPTKGTLTRAKEICLAAGVLAPGGPRKIVITPSLTGGVVLTLFVQEGDLSIAIGNHGDTILVRGRGWSGELEVEEPTHREAVEWVRSYCRSD